MLSQLNGSCTHSVREYECDIGYYVLRPKTDVVAVKTLALSVDEPQVVSDSMSDNSNSIVKPWFYFAVLHGFCIGRPTRSRMLLS